MGFCMECGNRLNDGVKFCDQCGTAVVDVEKTEERVSEVSNLRTNESQVYDSADYQTEDVLQTYAALPKYNASQSRTKRFDLKRHLIFSYIVAFMGIPFLSLFADAFGGNGIGRLIVYLLDPLTVKRGRYYRSSYYVISHWAFGFALITGVIFAVLLIIYIIYEITTRYGIRISYIKGLCPICGTENSDSNDSCKQCGGNIRHILKGWRVRFIPLIIVALLELLTCHSVHFWNGAFSYEYGNFFLAGMIASLPTVVFIILIINLCIQVRNYKNIRDKMENIKIVPRETASVPITLKAYCTGCGKELGKNDSFCMECGTPTINNAVGKETKAEEKVFDNPVTTRVNVVNTEPKTEKKIYYNSAPRTEAKIRNNPALTDVIVEIGKLIRTHKIITYVSWPFFIASIVFLFLSPIEWFFGCAIVGGVILIVALVIDIIASSRVKYALSEDICSMCGAGLRLNKEGYCTSCNKKAKQILFDNRIRALHPIILIAYLLGLYFYAESALGGLRSFGDWFNILYAVPGFLKTYVIQGTLYVLFLPLLFKVYMYPKRTAQRTEHPAVNAIGTILVINLFLPVPVNIIVWIVLLMWASSGRNESVMQKMNAAATEQMVEKVIAAQQAQNAQEPSKPKISDQLLELKTLFDAGVITEEEFNEKKKQLLEMM